MPTFKDLTGKTFGYLTVVKRDTSVKKGVKWLCNCVCGKQISVVAGNLSSGNTKSCGCKHSQFCKGNNLKHGYTIGIRHPIYKSWEGAKSRCMNPNDSHYSDYGARGIKMCDRWLDSFENFREDMESSWKKGLSIERKDVNGDYSPENCRWATTAEQNRNRRDTRQITWRGKTHCIAQWAEILGIKKSTLWRRLKNTDVETAFTTPVSPGGHTLLSVKQEL